MKETGIVRQIDRNGRLVIPKELRARYGLDIGAFAEFTVENDAIVIRKQSNPCCIFCGRNEDITIFRDKLICGTCIEDLSNSK
jgi:transcriptional pleiotropic regulator of transition state genes